VESIFDFHKVFSWKVAGNRLDDEEITREVGFPFSFY